jgi:hypothetical protein
MSSSKLTHVCMRVHCGAAVFKNIAWNSWEIWTRRNSQSSSYCSSQSETFKNSNEYYVKYLGNVSCSHLTDDGHVDTNDTIHIVA